MRRGDNLRSGSIVRRPRGPNKPSADDQFRSTAEHQARLQRLIERHEEKAKEAQLHWRGK